MTIRTRIAPSPSSAEKTLHLGNVRTALYAYLVAKKAGGDFILRIENTDVPRNVEGCAEGMLDDLVWLGIAPNEGFGTNNQPYAPYTQLEKLTRYRQMAEYLLERGLAYKCVCSEELLNAQREEAMKRNPKAPFKYPSTCRNLKHDPDKGYVIRFKAPLEGETIHDDLVFGKITYPHKENYDWVIMRDNGVPLYNFSVMIDDMDMQITHVIRGRDHSGQNTLIQSLLYKAFDANIPTWSHLSMVNNASGIKLAKRDGAVSVKSVRALGYTPQSVINYIAKLGWGNGNSELFSLGELTELFDLKNCGKADVKFDHKKFSAIAYEHLKSQSLTPDTTYAQHLHPFLQSAGINTTVEHLKTLIPLVRTRSRTLLEACNELTPVLQQNITIDQPAVEKILTPEAKTKLSAFNTFLQSVNDWTETNLRTATNDWLASQNLTIKDIGQPTRCAIYGRTQSPELFQVMGVMGKETVLNRIKAQL
jgi:glutamyl-tRNA synthetase